MLSLAQFELRRIREGWKDAQDRAKARGVHIGMARVGYLRQADGTLAEHPEHLEVVKEAFALRSRGGSWGETARLFTERGVPTARSSRAWSRQSVHHLIRNRAYRAPDGPIPAWQWDKAQPDGSRSRAMRGEGYTLGLGLCRCATCDAGLGSMIDLYALIREHGDVVVAGDNFERGATYALRDGMRVFVPPGWPRNGARRKIATGTIAARRVAKCGKYDTRHEDSLARLLRGVDADGVRLEAEFGFCWRAAVEALDRRFRSCARVRSRTPRRRLGERRRPGLRSCSRMSDRRRRSKLDGQIVKIARRPARTQGPGVSHFPQFATLGVSARAQLAWLHLAAMLGPALATLTESGMRPETTRER